MSDTMSLSARDHWFMHDASAEAAAEAEAAGDAVLASGVLVSALPRGVASVLSDVPREHLDALERLLQPMYSDPAFAELLNWFLLSAHAIELAFEHIQSEAQS